MKLHFIWLLLGLLLVFALTPAATSAALSTVYADSTWFTGPAGTCTTPNSGDGTFDNPVRLCPLSLAGTLNNAYFQPAIDKFGTPGTGTLFFTYQAGDGSGLHWSKYVVTSGNVDLRAVASDSGRAPDTGNPIADSLLWIGGIAAALLLVGAGLVLRSRPLATR